MALLLPILGFLLGCFLGLQIYNATTIPVEDWQLLNKPPENIVEIVGADFDNIWVRTGTGKLYNCYWITPYDNDCWVEITAVPDETWDEGKVYEGPPYPGSEPVKQSLAMYYFIFGDDSAVKYVLLENGNVIKWAVGGFRILRAPHLISRYLVSVCGPGYISLFIAIVLSIVIFKRKVVLGKS